ncbi:unnamed protein product [Vitrella brassicaformis CCMP3155]|uniref:ABM domain-containing protein n=2 Tax=Vitrella brassicaformis TaxID=1169539 RepID=A0A0G4H4B5_VITBC|nr:unnamed protein product [Vitrella brassicaformis CCMP3155]|eukprot:CEM38607.1 unnamed protein product [Vitrella brassicaformis CCMP3155]
MRRWAKPATAVDAPAAPAAASTDGKPRLRKTRQEIEDVFAPFVENWFDGRPNTKLYERDVITAKDMLSRQQRIQAVLKEEKERQEAAGDGRAELVHTAEEAGTRYDLHILPDYDHPPPTFEEQAKSYPNGTFAEVWQDHQKMEQRKADEMQEGPTAVERFLFSSGFEGVRQYLNSNLFVGVELLLLFLFFSSVDCGWTGDWSMLGWLTNDVEAYARQTVYALLGIRLFAAPVSAFLAVSKGLDWRVNAARTFLFGVADMMRVGLADDKETREYKRFRETEPLHDIFTSDQLLDNVSERGLMLSMVLKSRKEKAPVTQELVRKYYEYVKQVDVETMHTVSAINVNQDPRGRLDFIIVERFADIPHLIRHQNEPAFKSFVAALQDDDCLEEPINLHIVGDADGQVQINRYPFGPGGEGGRDDALFSSPINLNARQH